MRVLDRFFGTRKFEDRDSGFESKIEACFGIESMLGRWDGKNNPRHYGIARKFWVGITGLKNPVGDPLIYLLFTLRRECITYKHCP